MHQHATAFAPGDRGIDRDADEGDDGTVIVVNIPEQRADEYVIFEEPNGRAWTVAEYNDPEVYAPDQPVVEAVYATSLDRALDDDWSRAAVVDYYRRGLFAEPPKKGGVDVRVYAFPVERIRPDSNCSVLIPYGPRS